MWRQRRQFGLLLDHVREVEAVLDGVSERALLRRHVLVLLGLLEVPIGFDALLHDAHVRENVVVERFDEVRHILGRLPALDLLVETQVGDDHCGGPTDTGSAVDEDVQPLVVEHVVEVLRGDE